MEWLNHLEHHVNYCWMRVVVSQSYVSSINAPVHSVQFLAPTTHSILSPSTSYHHRTLTGESGLPVYIFAHTVTGSQRSTLLIPPRPHTYDHLRLVKYNVLHDTTNTDERGITVYCQSNHLSHRFFDQDSVTYITPHRPSPFRRLEKTRGLAMLWRGRIRRCIRWETRSKAQWRWWKQR